MDGLGSDVDNCLSLTSKVIAPAIAHVALHGKLQRALGLNEHLQLYQVIFPTRRQSVMQPLRGDQPFII